jgi:hypothetical protein
MINRELLAPCGLYCGVCGILSASRDHNEKLKGKLAAAYGLKPEQIQCSGCLSNSLFTYCRVCAIRKCSRDRNLEGCHLCKDFPCAHVHNYPFAEAREKILAAVPEWRELGTAKFVEQQEKKWQCPKCSTPLFRGARRCHNCKELLPV